MPTALGLTIGVATLDPSFYGDLGARLPFPAGPAGDAEQFARLLRGTGVDVRTLHGAARRGDILAGLEGAARTLRAGDLFVLYYAGHGGRITNRTGEGPPMLNVLCVTDGFLLDVQVDARLSLFARGVRLVAVVDACHSASATRRLPLDVPPWLADAMERGTYSVRALADRAIADLEQQHISALTALAVAATQARRTRPLPYDASLLELAACHEADLAGEISGQGLYTMSLLAMWNRNARRERDSYQALHDSIARDLRGAQEPSLSAGGSADPDFLTRTATFRV